MTRRLIGAAGIGLALLGCNEDPSQLPVVDGPRAPSSAPAPPATIPPLLAARDDKPAAKDDTPKTPDDLLKKGLQQANGGELVAAIATLEEAHKLDPKHRQVLLFLTLARQIHAAKLQGKPQTEMFLRSAESARALRALEGGLNPNERGLVGQALYNEACAFARQGEADRAMSSLNEAVDAGFSDAKALAADDALAALRDRPEFTKLVDKVKESAKRAAREQDEAMTRQMLPEVKTELGRFKSFPFAFELPGLDGKPVKLAEAKGKVTIVDIWGTWCPPCRMEVPHFVAIRNNYKDRGVEVIGVNKERVPPSKVKETIESFARENGINYTLVIGDDKVEEQVPEFSGYPTTLFLDGEGKVRYKHVGYAPYEVIEFVVKTLLDEKKSP